MDVEICPGCAVELPPHDGPVHRYMESSPSCWAAYGEVLAREFSDYRYMAVHRLTVDTYAVQHPGQPSPQSIQSVSIHLMALHLIFEQGWKFEGVPPFLSKAANRFTFAWLDPPADLGSLTVSHVLAAESSEEHGQRVEAWSRSVWDAWAPHHPQIRTWAEEVLER